MSPVQVERANQYASYRKGWRDGSLGGSHSPELAMHTNHLIRFAYGLGYQAGSIARDRAAKRASRLYNHKPSVMR